MQSKDRPAEAAAEIDAGLKALFDALSAAPAPPAILNLIDQLEQGAVAALAGAAAPRQGEPVPPPATRRVL